MKPVDIELIRKYQSEFEDVCQKHKDCEGCWLKEFESNDWCVLAFMINKIEESEPVTCGECKFLKREDVVYCKGIGREVSPDWFCGNGVKK